MQKCKRREALIFLLGGVACLGGCQTSSGFKKPTLPENCYWLELKYAWFCIDYDVKPSTGAPAGGSDSSQKTDKQPDNSSELLWGDQDFSSWFSPPILL